MTRLSFVIALLLLCVTASANAQTAPAPAPKITNGVALPAVIETPIPARLLTDLPSSGGLYALIETIEPAAIANRIEGGGIYAGTPAHIGAHGSSWTQTLFRVGDINITDPDGSGTPLALPGVLEWDHVGVNTGIMAVDVNAPGMVVDLTPRRPSSTWVRQAEASIGPPTFQAGRNGTMPPSIARLDSYANGSVLLSGPVRERLGIVFAGTYTHATRHERASTTALRGAMGSAFAHLVYAASPRDEVRTVLWAQRSTTPVDHPLIFQEPDAQENATSVSLQTTWERRGAAGAPSWRAYAALTARGRSQDAVPRSVLSMERLNEPPPWEQIYPGPGTDKVWQIGARMKPAAFEALNRQHHTTAGLEVSGGSASHDAWFNGRIGELVNGIPARVWDFSSPGTASQWHQVTFAAYADDTVVLRPRLTGTAGLRFEHLGAAADGATSSVSWTNLLPRFGLRWDFTTDGRLNGFANYGRYGYEVRLRDLAYGDPSAVTANVYKWNAPVGTTMPHASAIGPLVERWGPGTGGNPGFSSVDPGLRRPFMDEIVFGFKYQPTPAWATSLAGIARRDKRLLALTNPGVPFSAYSKSVVIDPGVDVVGGTTTQPLPIYNRPTSTFGADRYLLTNNPDTHAFFTGVDVTAQLTLDRLYLLIGGTAGRSEGWASNVGFRYNENDNEVLGEVFVDPNANTFAKGRPFTERGYTLHASGVYRFAHDVRLGVAARYQDGQHFSRLVVAPDLNQGPELVRAFANGETRFTFTCTVDARLQKGFEVSGLRVDAIVDVFDLLNLGLEVEEVTVTGPTSRQTSAIQPPRALHIGVRVGF